MEEDDDDDDDDDDDNDEVQAKLGEEWWNLARSAKETKTHFVQKNVYPAKIGNRASTGLKRKTLPHERVCWIMC